MTVARTVVAAKLSTFIQRTRPGFQEVSIKVFHQGGSGIPSRDLPTWGFHKEIFTKDIVQETSITGVGCSIKGVPHSSTNGFLLRKFYGWFHQRNYHDRSSLCWPMYSVEDTRWWRPCWLKRCDGFRQDHCRASLWRKRCLECTWWIPVFVGPNWLDFACQTIRTYT